MKKLFLLSFLSGLLLDQGSAAILKVPTRNLTSEATIRRQTTLRLAEEGPVTAPPWLIVGDSVSAFTDTNGVAWYSNVLAAKYVLTIAGTPGRSFPISVFDTNGILDASLLVNSTNYNAAFYTAAQVDALLAAGGGGSGGTVATETNSIYVSALDGDDDTGARGNRNLPFLTVTAAMAASQSGDIIYVLRGQYVENFLGADGVVFDLATDALVGGATMPGPIFLADSIDYRIQGNGFITATNTKPSVMTSGTGTIYLSGVTLSPNTVTNNVKGTWFTP